MIEVRDPATLELIAVVPESTTSDLDAAVRGAESAQAQWASADRGRALESVAKDIDAEADALALLLTREQGKPLAEALLEVGQLVSAFGYFAGVSIPDEQLTSAALPGQRVVRRFQPFGVVGAIPASNFPVTMFGWKTASALAVGNAVVVKSPPTTPLAIAAVVEIVARHVPEGLVTALAGGGDIGAALVAHPGVPKISFTGATETGRAIMGAGAARLKHLTLELGGNDAAIVLPDADLPNTVALLAGQALRNAGQVCIAPKRILVHDSIANDVRDLFVAHIEEQVRPGHGVDPATTMGPLNTAAQRDRVRDLVLDAQRRGAQVLSPIAAPALPGHFHAPAVIAEATPDMSVVTQEQFGPAIPLIRFRDEEHALALANDSEMALGGSVWSQDVDRAVALAERVVTGTCWVNSHGPNTVDISFRGLKQSGIGSELGREGVEELGQWHTIRVPAS